LYEKGIFFVHRSPEDKSADFRKNKEESKKKRSGRKLLSTFR